MAAGITHARLQRGDIRVALEAEELIHHNFTFTRESRYLNLDLIMRHGAGIIVKGTRKSADICVRACALTLSPSIPFASFQIPTCRDTGMQRDGDL